MARMHMLILPARPPESKLQGDASSSRWLYIAILYTR
jgi:hypothetical protein